MVVCRRFLNRHPFFPQVAYKWLVGWRIMGLWLCSWVIGHDNHILTCDDMHMVNNKNWLCCARDADCQCKMHRTILKKWTEVLSCSSSFLIHLQWRNVFIQSKFEAPCLLSYKEFWPTICSLTTHLCLCYWRCFHIFALDLNNNNFWLFIVEPVLTDCSACQTWFTPQKYNVYW